MVRVSSPQPAERARVALQPEPSRKRNGTANRKPLLIALAVGILALLLFWFTRLPGIANFPFFIDEGLHVYFSEVTAQRHPFIYANKYYLFSIWWWTLFGVPFAAPIWLSRVVTLLAVLPGVAAVIGLGRQAAGARGALFGALLYLFSTYHFFFERLALADPISASAALLSVYFAFRLSQRVNHWDAALTGLAAFLALGAKLSALPYLGVPVAAALFLRPPHATPRQRWRWLAVALVTEGVSTALFVLALVIAGRNPFANAADHVGLSEGGIGEMLARIPRSAGYMLENLAGFITPAGVGLVALALLFLLVQRRFFLLACLIAPAAAFLLSDMQGSRYYAAPMGVLLLCLAVAFAELSNAYRKPLKPLIGALLAFILLGWGWVGFRPFLAQMNDAPTSLALPAHDYREYLASDASGVGLETVRDLLRQHDAERVIGIMANCQGLRYESFGLFPVECPTINPSGETIPELEALMNASRAEDVYVVLEAIDYLPDSAPGRVVGTVNAATNRPRLTLYSLAP